MVHSSETEVHGSVPPSPVDDGLGAYNRGHNQLFAQLAFVFGAGGAIASSVLTVALVIAGAHDPLLGWGGIALVWTVYFGGMALAWLGVAEETPAR
jgi:hypothetical protein